MDECVRRAQEKCPNLRYRILEGTSETRLRDAPPFERAYHTSHLRLTCTNDGAEPLISLGSESKDSAAPLPSAHSAAPPPKAAPAACVRGETRECVGAGACKGGQACLADGSGFSDCDCGSPPSAVGVPVAPAPAPAPSATTPAPSSL